MDELKLRGNCLKGSRPVLSFAKEFDGEPWGRVCKEVFTHVRIPQHENECGSSRSRTDFRCPTSSTTRQTIH